MRDGRSYDAHAAAGADSSADFVGSSAAPAGTGKVDAARAKRSRHLVLRLGAYALRIERRAAPVTAAILFALIVLGVIGMLLGDYPLSLGDVLASLAGTHGDQLGQYFVREIRLPRVLVAFCVGAALGVSGAIFQGISNNPLGSPDIIGFTTGAATGALVQIILFESGPAEIAIGALIAGFGTAAIVYSLSWRSGLSGYRLVLVGIGASAVLAAVNSLLVVRASLTAAQTAAQWLAGSLNTVGAGQLGLVGVTVLLLVPAALVLSRSLDAMTMGDEIATGFGVRVERTRLAALSIGIALVSTATAATGPIAFVALAAPQIAKRLTGSARIGFGAAALTGAALVCASDLIAQRLFSPTQLPVGVGTGSLGGIYLIWLLSSEWRKKAA